MFDKIENAKSKACEANIQHTVASECICSFLNYNYPLKILIYKV